MTDEYEFDVAFSFTQRDEALAEQLNGHLAGRMSTFIYSERQKEIAGTDGVESFSAVYGKKARIVAVLYRKEWGETRWTAVEMNAIRSRAFESGFDFTIFIPTEDKPVMPPWVPPTRLYVGLERWGVTGAAAVIEQRVTEAGGRPHQETVTERAARLAKMSEFLQKRDHFERSEEGVQAANEAYQRLGDALSSKAEAIKGIGVQILVRERLPFRLVSLGRVHLVCSWQPHYRNSIEGIHLKVEFHLGLPPLPGFYNTQKSRLLLSRRYKYALVRPDTHAYVSSEENGRDYTAEQLADRLLTELMDAQERAQSVGQER